MKIGDIVTDPDGDRAKITEEKDNFFRLLLLSGQCKGKLLWTMKKDVKEDVNDTGTKTEIYPKTDPGFRNDAADNGRTYGGYLGRGRLPW